MDAATAAIIGALIAFASSSLVWFLNERSKRADEEYKRREGKYAELIKSLKGFYVGSETKGLKEIFIEQLNLCWMYCPDEVIQKGNRMLDLLGAKVGTHPLEGENERAVGELILAIRKDLISRKAVTETKLTADDFRHVAAR